MSGAEIPGYITMTSYKHHGVSSHNRIGCLFDSLFRPGACPTNDISIEFEIRPKFSVIWFKK